MKNEKSSRKVSSLLRSKSYTLKIVRKKEPLKSEVLSDSEIKDLTNSYKSDSYFHKYFNTKIAIQRGDVFVVRFDYGCGNELSGPHFVVALNNSKENDPMVMVVPLKSYKGTLNPRSDVLLGIVEGTKTGKQSIALINQIKSIDKCLMLEHLSIRELSAILDNDKLSENDEIDFREKIFHRLTEQQYKILLNAVNGFLNFGFIRH
jgi:mRNA-degrading endonuclease toxin of MazEF toxin-antitoxin module